MSILGPLMCENFISTTLTPSFEQTTSQLKTTEVVHQPVEFNVQERYFQILKNRPVWTGWGKMCNRQHRRWWLTWANLSNEPINRRAKQTTRKPKMICVAQHHKDVGLLIFFCNWECFSFYDLPVCFSPPGPSSLSEPKHPEGKRNMFFRFSRGLNDLARLSCGAADQEVVHHSASARSNPASVACLCIVKAKPVHSSSWQRMKERAEV